MLQTDHFRVYFYPEERAAVDDLFAVLYAELHRLASRQLGRNPGPLTMGTTTLLHEATHQLFFESRLPQRPRALLRIFVYLAIFVPTIGLLTAGSIRYALDSVKMRELASSSWAPAVYPYKILMAVGLILWFLQGLVTLVDDFRSLRNP